MHKKEPIYHRMTSVPHNPPVTEAEVQSGTAEEIMPSENQKQELEYNGKITVQLPISLHRQLSELAKEEGVTLEQFIIYKLAR